MKISNPVSIPYSVHDDPGHVYHIITECASNYPMDLPVLSSKTPTKGTKI